jgi:hypothetical protein
MYFNLFIVFSISGFWHGANWTFIIWGALHGFYLIFSLATKTIRKKISAGIGISRVYWLNNTMNVITTFALVTFAWVFFRSKNVADAFLVVKKLFLIPKEIAKVIATRKIEFLNIPDLFTIIIPGFGLIVFLEIAHIMQVKFGFGDSFAKKPALVRWGIYYAGLAMLFYFGIYEKRQFIYFQF